MTHKCADCFFHNDESWVCSNYNSRAKTFVMNPETGCREWTGWRNEEIKRYPGTCSFCLFHDDGSGTCGNGLSPCHGSVTSPSNFCDEYQPADGGLRQVRIKLDYYAYLPTRAHETDAGLDLKSPMDVTVGPMAGAEIPTGVHVQLPAGSCGLLVSKSGLNTKHDITSTGLIDEGYTGEIVVKIYNHGAKPYHVHAGDKISQLVVLPVHYETVELVDSLDESARGSAGFGSTGR